MAATNTPDDKSIRAAIKRASTAHNAVRAADGGGLRLDVQPTGAAWWRWRCRFGGKEGTLSLGTYPDTSLSQARGERDDARVQVAAGIDPSQARKDGKLQRAQRAEVARQIKDGLPVVGTFEHAARAWHGRQAPQWSEGHTGKVLSLMQRDLFPCIGTSVLRDLTPLELLKQASRIEARGATETAYRALKAAGAVFRLGVSEGWCDSEPRLA